MTDTQSLTAYINNLKYMFDYSGRELSANYTYKFRIDASYNNMEAAGAGKTGAMRRSLSSEIIDQSINAVIPKNFDVIYESPPSGKGNNITIKWAKTDASFNNIHEPIEIATNISYVISFNNIYHYNDFSKPVKFDVSNMEVNNDDSYIFGDRGFSGNSITGFQVRAKYKYFESDWTAINKKRIAKHIPVFDSFENNVNNIKLKWKETTGATHYDISREDYFYNTSDEMASSNTNSFVQDNNIQSKDGVSITYTDNSPPLGEKKPRKYKYTIRAHYN